MAEDAATPTVTIDLLGEIVTLRPDLGPAMGISAVFGGIFVAGQRAMQGDILAIAQIVRIGAGLDAKLDAELAGKVLKAGISNVSPKAMEYISLLMNGGTKDAAGDGASRDGAAPGEGEPSGQPRP